MDEERLQGFGFHPASSSNAYVAVDWTPGCTTGVSGKDRAATLRALCDTANSTLSFKRPGHTFPVCVSKDGVLKTALRPEAAYDLCRLTGLASVAALAEMMNEDGESATNDEAMCFCREHNLPLLHVERLASYRKSQAANGVLTEPVLGARSKMWVEEITAETSMHVYSGTADPSLEIVAVVKGAVAEQEGVACRIHSECFTGDVLASQRCDCGQQLHRFLRIMNEESYAVLLYIRGQEGRGIGLQAKIRAYKLQDEGHDTVDANLKLGLPVDTRSYDDALGVLNQLGVKSVRLFTNNPAKMRSIQHIVKEVVSIPSVPHARNMKYLKTKRERLNHLTLLEPLPEKFSPPERATASGGNAPSDSRPPESTPDTPPESVVVSEKCVGIVHVTSNTAYVNFSCAFKTPGSMAVEKLRSDAESELQRAGAKCIKIAVPGVCNLMSGVRLMLREHNPDAVIVVGVAIKDDSSALYDLTCKSVVKGVTDLNTAQDTPIILGLLTCQDEEQANAQSNDLDTPAKAWAESALQMALLSTGSIA
eukprot:CAMPEP_0197704012 /NCGR_PEP_ID=MMETSP1338-20131121/125725_1 /TAXON_ID=43686 ORGANISM="Pelagodinium beii, Strain RCC1491" /NCGR_SAMPLE_ID=MMETSP1338 /ASSEMBLY_ACC=CAM_ASM_000754 /LENGTH=535 /DNA_ID=CAMNT_0043287911 /DNA_START=561 /DNA_END=2168 /DNA_ORIENTATION=-